MQTESIKEILRKISLMHLHSQDRKFQPVLLLELIDDISDEITESYRVLGNLETMKIACLKMKEHFTKRGLMGTDEWSTEELEEQYKKERKLK